MFDIPLPIFFFTKEHKYIKNIKQKTTHSFTYQLIC